MSIKKTLMKRMIKKNLKRYQNEMEKKVSVWGKRLNKKVGSLKVSRIF